MSRPAREFSTDALLWQRWQEHAARQPDADAVVFWVAGEEPYRWKWRSLLATASRWASLLADRGVRGGDVCALMLRHHRDFYPLYMGVESLGAIPAVLAYPNERLHPDKFRQGVEGMAQRSGLKWLLADRQLESIVRPLATHAGSSIREILFPLDWSITPDDGRGPPAQSPETLLAGPEQPCLLQHSSGTTGLQKAVVLSHRAVLEHAARYGEAIGLRGDDKVVSWLPLYHDMGLIAAFHLPLAFGIPTVQMDPFEWVKAPVLMLEAISQERATVAWLPNFAYHLMADRVHDEDLEGVRLDSLRVLINCSEPVRCESHAKFASRFGPLGLRRECLTVCYAMAETTFAVTQSAIGREAKVLAAARDHLAQGTYRPAADGDAVRYCVSSGRLIRGCAAKIVGPDGGEVPRGTVGEILIRSVSMFDGYRNYEEKTREALRDGWYASGDLGFCWDDEFYVIGRRKDIIIVAGKNLYPEDIEDAIGNVPGVIPGRVLAFGIDDPQSGTEQICVVAETECDAGAQKALRRGVLSAGMQIDVTIGRVFFVPSRWLIKSSAGKPSRSANRQRIVEDFHLA